MATKGTYTPAEAVKMGMVPAQPFARVINRWAADKFGVPVEEQGRAGGNDDGATTALSLGTGLSTAVLLRLRFRGKEWIHFDNADKIVTYIDPFLWYSDAELRAIYEGFDFSYLDVQRPTCDEADPLHHVEGLTTRAAAVALGVNYRIIQGARRGDRAGGPVAA